MTKTLPRTRPTLPPGLRPLGPTVRLHPLQRARLLFFELSLWDLVVLHDALLLVLADRELGTVPVAVEQLEILARRLSTALMREGVR